MTKDKALKLALEALEWEEAQTAYPSRMMIEAITAIKQALALDKMAENARELGLDYEPVGGIQITKVWWDDEKLMAKPIPFVEFYKPVQEPLAHSVVAGALFDFMGWMTSRKERIVLSSVDNASPAVEAIIEFAKMRGLSLDDAKVMDWHEMTRGNDAA